MSEEQTEREPDRRILAEISALADGTLDDANAERVRALVATSPELTARLERERAAFLALQSLTADRAPANLRYAIETKRSRASRRRWRVRYIGPVAAATALAATLVVLLLPAGELGAPSISQAAALALRGPTLSAPASNGPKLTLGVGEVYFPNWAWIGWQPSGWRTDRLDGKLAMTVYYRSHGKQIAYTILSSPPLRRPGSRIIHMDGVALQSFVLQGRLVVTWRHTGHTCVLSGEGMSTRQLAKLAGWQDAS